MIDYNMLYQKIYFISPQFSFPEKIYKNQTENLFLRARAIEITVFKVKVIKILNFFYQNCQLQTKYDSLP